jgi:hypothetical protein
VDPETNEPRLYDGIVTRYEYCEDKKKYMYWIVFPEDESGLYFSEYQGEQVVDGVGAQPNAKTVGRQIFWW